MPPHVNVKLVLPSKTRPVTGHWVSELKNLVSSPDEVQKLTVSSSVGSPLIVSSHPQQFSLSFLSLP